MPREAPQSFRPGPERDTLLKAWAIKAGVSVHSAVLSAIDLLLETDPEKSVEVARRRTDQAGYAKPRLDVSSAPYAGDLPKRGYGEVAPRAKPGKAGFGKAKS